MKSDNNYEERIKKLILYSVGLKISNFDLGDSFNRVYFRPPVLVGIKAYTINRSKPANTSRNTIPPDSKNPASGAPVSLIRSPAVSISGRSSATTLKRTVAKIMTSIHF